VEYALPDLYHNQIIGVAVQIAVDAAAALFFIGFDRSHIILYIYDPTRTFDNF
jgi:hypothetical protein